MNKKYLIGALFIFITAITMGLLILKPQRKENQDGSRTSNLIPIDSITHGHGLAVDVADSNKLYIATHHGLLVLINEKDLYRIGKNQDDFMGFSPHPTDPKVFFTSGHPKTGGNLGFQKSDDGGFTWKKISSGVYGPVDFHAMAVSPVNPNQIYGWYRGKLQRSSDGGNNWEAFDTNFVIVSLAGDSKDENIVYATTPQGIMVSRNKGQEWQDLSAELKGTLVTSLAPHPQDPQEMVSFSEKLKLAKSTNQGTNWQKINETFSGEGILFIAFSKVNPSVVYALTDTNALYKSTNEGDSWTKIR